MALSPHRSPVVADELMATDKNSQTFFILHEAPAMKSEKKPSAANVGTRRKFDTCSQEEEDDAINELFSLEAFEMIWSKIDSTAKEVLRKRNTTLFEEIHQWVLESFSTIKSTDFAHIVKPYPLVKGATLNRIPTALVFTKNIEFVDDMQMFQDLKEYMLSNGCHAALLSALKFSMKDGIGSCLKSLCRQLISDASVDADVHLIASWYCDSENYHKPIAVIIDDMERCDGAVLADFVKMLSEWVIKIPITLILGVTTTFDGLRKLLPSSVLLNLQFCKFRLESPERRMDSLIESILVKSCSGIFIDHKVAGLLKKHFLRLDGTITSFLKALKLACVKHLIGEPLSLSFPGMLHEDCEDLIGDPRRALQDDLLKSERYLHSTCGSEEVASQFFSHDTAIMFSLTQEYGDLINLHDLYHSFKAKLFIHATKGKRKSLHSSASKKGKLASMANEATIQARFCRAVTELQITGLVRMPSKKRPDFLLRICL